MNTTFVLNGGAGRVIASIPALEKFHRLNPQDDFKVLVYGWEGLFWSHPLLQKKTFSIGQKGMFDLFIKDSNLIVPEPYCRRSYYTQKKSMIETFDEEINQTNDHSDLQPPALFLQKQEIISMQIILQEKLNEKRRNKIVVFQPYGSGMQMLHGRPFDSTIRSLDVDDYYRIAKSLSEDALVVYFGEKDYIHPADDFSFKPTLDMQVDLRFWMTCISQCNHFLGIDSVGQHIAYAFKKSGTVIMGSTIEKNVTYPQHFEIYRNGLTPTYNSIRISPLDSEFADRENDGLMDFTENQIAEICNKVKFSLKTSS
jgi:hypothetical protein